MAIEATERTAPDGTRLWQLRRGGTELVLKADQWPIPSNDENRAWQQAIGAYNANEAAWKADVERLRATWGEWDPDQGHNHPESGDQGEVRPGQ